MREMTRQRLEVLCNQMVEVARMVREDTERVLALNQHVETIRHFNELRSINARIKESREALSEIEDRLSTQDLPEQMRAAGVKTVTVEGVGRVTISHRFSASMLDKDRAIQWLRDNGHESLIQETVNSSTLSAFAKNLLSEEGKELPSELFKTGTMPFTSITKAK